MSATDLPGAGWESSSASQPRTVGDGAAKATLQRATDSLRDSARRYMDTAQRRAGAIQDRTLQVVRERPGATIGGAVAVALIAGIAIGFLLSNVMAGED